LSDLPQLPIADVNISDCRLSGNLRAFGGSGQGSAPAPTSTPLPIDSSRDDELVRLEITEYRNEMTPVLELLIGFHGKFRETWPDAVTPEQQAAQLHVIGNRLAQLCSAASQVSIPPEISGEGFGLGQAIRATHAWVNLANNELVCCNDAKIDSMDVGFVLTTAEIDWATAVIYEIFRDYEITSEIPGERTLVAEKFGFEMTIDKSAVIMRNSIDLLVIYPKEFEVLEPASLGPKAWNSGAGLRVRRLRNTSELSVEQAVDEYESLIALLGDPVRIVGMDITDYDEIRLSIPNLEDDWIAEILVFVSDGFTYFIESLCRAENSTVCEQVERSVESLRAS